MTRPVTPLTTTDRSVELLALRPKDAARCLGVSERTLWDWTRTEGLPHVRIGNVVLYPVGCVKQWLADRVDAAALANIKLPPIGSTGCTVDE
jgi:excisionase family DNA binding protein